MSIRIEEPFFRELTVPVAPPAMSIAHAEDGKHLRREESRWLLNQWRATFAANHIVANYNTHGLARTNIFAWKGIHEVVRVFDDEEQPSSVRKALTLLSHIDTRVLQSYKHMNLETFLLKTRVAGFRYYVNGGMKEPRISMGDGGVLEFARRTMALGVNKEITLHDGSKVDHSLLLPHGVSPETVGIARLTFIPHKLGAQNKPSDYGWTVKISYTLRRKVIRKSFIGDYNKKKEITEANRLEVAI